jgi:hypothetical protein
MRKVLISFALSLFMLAGVIGTLPEAKAVPARDFVVTTAVITAPVTVQPTQQYVITATGFQANERAELYFQKVGEAAPGIKLTPPNTTADGTGQLVFTATIPDRFPQGAAWIRAKNVSGSLNQTATTTLNPYLKLDTASGAIGSPLSGRGLSFAASEVYTVTFTDDATGAASADCVGGGATEQETLQVATTTNIGSFVFNSSVPDVPPGTYKVVAVGAISQICVID